MLLYLNLDQFTISSRVILMQAPHFDYEQELWNQGLRLIAGCDEVGRGCIAGPVVTGIVVFKPETNITVYINDSKKLNVKQRVLADKWIRENALGYAVGVGNVSRINKYGIVGATNYAYRSAIRALQSQFSESMQFLLTDAFYIPKVRHIPVSKQRAIVRGDSQSFSIAAASIIAKVYRDALMCDLARSARYNHFQWEKNKGYGTREHREAIQLHGTSKYHRSLFVRNIV